MRVTTVKRTPAPLLFGGPNAANTNTRRWLAPGFYNTTLPTSERPQDADVNLVLTSIRVRCVAGTGAATVTYTVFVDGVATGVLVAMSNTATSATATGFSVAVSAGQRVSVAVDKSASVTAGQTDIAAVVGASAA